MVLTRSLFLVFHFLGIYTMAKSTVAVPAVAVKSAAKAPKTVKVRVPRVKSQVELDLAAARVALKTAKEAVKTLAAQAKADREASKTDRAARAQARRDAAIAKAKAKLDKLMTKPVGAVARKAAKKPSKAVVTKVAAE